MSLRAAEKTLKARRGDLATTGPHRGTSLLRSIRWRGSGIVKGRCRLAESEGRTCAAETQGVSEGSFERSENPKGAQATAAKVGRTSGLELKRPCPAVPVLIKRNNKTRGAAHGVK